MEQDRLLVIVAHSRLGRLARLALSRRGIHFSAMAVGLAFVVIVGLTAEFVRATNENTRLSAEIEALRNQQQSMSMTLEERDRQVESLSALAYQVSVAYGIRRDRHEPQPLFTDNLPATYYASLSQFDRLQAAVDSRVGSLHGLLANTTPSIWPVRGRITSTFGRRTDPFSGNATFHSGIDIRAPNGTPVWATADGIVRSAGWEAGGLGRTITVSHGEAGFGTRYGHLNDSLVRVGQMVQRGEVIGSVGATGKTTGNHLHYEVSYKGQTVNPYRYLRPGLPAYARELSD